MSYGCNIDGEWLAEPWTCEEHYYVANFEKDGYCFNERGKKTDDIAWCEAFYYGNPAAEEDGEEEIIVAPDIVTGDYFQDWGCFDVENNWIRN